MRNVRCVLALSSMLVVGSPQLATTQASWWPARQITITSPPDGLVVAPGALITFTGTVGNKPTYVNVQVVGPDGTIFLGPATFDSSGNFTCPVRWPNPCAAGTYTATVTARTLDGYGAGDPNYTDSVNLRV